MARLGRRFQQVGQKRVALSVVSFHALNRCLKPQAPARLCLFCDRRTNSPEHLWPVWARRYFERTPHDERAEGSLWVARGDQRQTTWRKRHGHTTTTTIRAVCKGCNNGWMSHLETDAKAFIEPMLIGHRVTMNRDQIQIVASWIVLKMMVYDSETPEEAVFTRQETLEFARNRSIPNGVMILLCKAKERENRAYLTRAFANISQIRGPFRIRARIQVTTFVIGRLVVFFSLNRVKSLKLNEPSQRRAKRLWPPRGAVVSWPPDLTATEMDVANISLALRHFVQSRGLVV